MDRSIEEIRADTCDLIFRTTMEDRDIGTKLILTVNKTEYYSIVNYLIELATVTEEYPAPVYPEPFYFQGIRIVPQETAWQ